MRLMERRKRKKEKKKSSRLIEGGKREIGAQIEHVDGSRTTVRRNTTCRVELHDYRPLAASAFVAGMQLPLLKPRPKPRWVSRRDQLEPSTGEKD